MSNRALILVAFCLVACSDTHAHRQSTRIDQAPVVDLDGAVEAEDLTGDTLFDFEQMQATGRPALPVTDGSNLLAMLGSDAQPFPGDVRLGPFKLGMTSQEVEQIARTRSLMIGLRQTSDGTGVDCTRGAGRSSARVVVHAIPASYDVSVKSGESYTIDFIDDAGRARVSEILWSPAGPYSRARWQAYLLKTFGRPTFRSQSAGDATWQWCSPEERRCDGSGRSRLASLGASENSNGDGAYLTLTAGENVSDAAGRIAGESETPATTAGAGSCKRTMTQGETRLFANYLASLNEVFAPDAPTVFRLALLPKGLQAALLFRLGAPSWFKLIGKDFVARYDVGYSRDPASYVETKYVAFAQTDGRAYAPVWQGDEKALRARYPAQAAARKPS